MGLGTESSLKATLRFILREGGAPLAILLTLILAFKILYQFDHQANNPLALHPVADEALYIKTAGAVAEGRISPEGTYHTAPLYPYLAAPVLATSGGDPLAMRLLQGLAGAASVLFLYVTARFFFPRYWALLAATAMGLYYPFTFFEGKMLIAACAVFFTNLCLLLLAGQSRASSSRWAAGAGLAAGFAAALRPNLLLLAPFVALWFLWAFRGRKGLIRCLLFLAAWTLPILPFTLHNLCKGGDFILLSDNGGINFYFGNNPEARGSFHVSDPAWGDIEYQHQAAKERAEQALGRVLKPSEVSTYWRKEGLRFVFTRPLEYLSLLALKLKSFIENFEYAIIYAPGVERSLTKSLYLPFIPYAVYIAAGFMGLVMMLLGRKINEGEGWFPVLMVLAVTLFSVLLFFNYSRFRLLAVPALILLGVRGVRLWFEFLKARSVGRLAAGTGTALVVLLVSLLPWGDQHRLQTAHGLCTVGQAFAKARDFESAQEYYDRALDIRPDLDIVLAERGKVRIELKDFAGARADLEEAVRLKPDTSSHFAALAGYYARGGAHRDLDRAIGLIEEALTKPAVSPFQRSYVLTIEGNIRMERKEFDLAARAYLEAYKVSDQVDNLFLAGLAFKEGGESMKAAATFEEVLRRESDHPQAAMELRVLNK